MRRLAEVRRRLSGWLRSVARLVRAWDLAGVRTTPKHRAADAPALRIVRDDDTPDGGYRYDNRNALAQFWRAEVNDEIGGWCVVINRPGTPATGNPPVVDMVGSFAMADHVARLHNEWLDRSVRNLRQ